MYLSVNASAALSALCISARSVPVCPVPVVACEKKLSPRTARHGRRTKRLSIGRGWRCALVAALNTKTTAGAASRSVENGTTLLSVSFAIWGRSRRTRRLTGSTTPATTSPVIVDGPRCANNSGTRAETCGFGGRDIGCCLLMRRRRPDSTIERRCLGNSEAGPMRGYLIQLIRTTRNVHARSRSLSRHIAAAWKPERAA